MSVEEREVQHNCWRVLARVILLCLFAFRYFLVDEHDSIDMRLFPRSNSVREELDESACAMDAAPLSPIRLWDNFNVVREELNDKVRAMAAAPVSFIRLWDKFNLVRIELDESACCISYSIARYI